MSNSRPWLDMKRCVLNADGSVNYYLDASDSTLKADGVTSSVLDGTDGNVMVEIPKFYYKHTLVGTLNTWQVSKLALSGFTLHPAFTKAGSEVNYRYIGAYDACYLDATDGNYKSGLNLNDMTSNLDMSNDKLASVSGIYPLVGVTRDECRTLAENVGAGWHQLDFALWSAIQMLYLVEYADFNTQANLGDGNTDVTSGYPSGSSNQTDSPHSVAGKSNSLGNASTDATSGASSASRDTAFMSYRGIENWYGNCWNWCDGINVNQGSAGNVHVTNDYTDFADNTTTGYTLLSSSFPTATGFIRNILNTGAYFLSGDNTGGSSTTYLADQHSAATALSLTTRFGGNGKINDASGAFCVNSIPSVSYSDRTGGARLAF